MVTREDLNRYVKYLNSLAAMDLWIESMYNTYRSPQMSGDGSSRPSSPGDPVWYACQRIEKAEKDREELRAKIKEIEEFVEAIEDPEEKSICILRYLNGYTWEATCWILRKHRSAAVLTRIDNEWWSKYEKEHPEIVRN
ncbi:MAG: hypothetical protein IKK95_03615 [Lachnospiraceae bacterium]|nr:hypothetical protein [Lachnospiraceae bacterium]